MTWTAERKELAKTLWKEGKSGGEIAEQLGVTRNSIIGIIHRAGLFRHEHPAPPGQRKPVKAKPARPAPVRKQAPRPVIVAGNTVFEVEDRPPVVVVPQKAFAPIPGSTPRPWTERGNGCSWPVDVTDAKIQHSCCRPKKDGHPNYCPEHHALSVSKANATAPRGSALVRSLRKAAA